ncbi:hypothetical protein Vadar_012837 [Vaccinium darrowii]|uniref:Uncharacterized protein n=1 Tax=Vaccinium darrowii TaxID=229202 RepID=A0ACB7ZBE6_9ERIC|nr:hypothetical protein Vadar_012837 [Vaccinium darrowii]
MFRQSTSRTFKGRTNVTFINITSYNILQQHPVPTPQHTVFAFLISSRLNFLELQYLGADTVSPFHTHRETMWVAHFSLLLYCIAYEFEPTFMQLGRGGMGLFGSILFTSLASVLFKNSVSLAPYFLYTLFSNREMLCSGIEVIRGWIHQKMVSDLFLAIHSIN